MKLEPTLRSFAQLYLEAEARRRPAKLLAPFMASNAQIGVPRVPVAEVPQIGQIHADATRDRCEAVVMLSRRFRCEPLVISLRRRNGSWKVTCIGRPDDVRAVTYHPSVLSRVFNTSTTDVNGSSPVVA